MRSDNIDLMERQMLDLPESIDGGPTGRVLTLDDDALVTASEAAREVGVSVETVQKWRQRDLIHPTGYLGRAALYSMRQIWDVERQTRRSGRSRRREG